MFASALVKFGLTFGWTPAAPPRIAEYQNGETSLRRSAFATAELMPAGRAGEVIQYGSHPVAIFGVSAWAAGAPTRSPDSTPSTAITPMTARRKT